MPESFVASYVSYLQKAFEQARYVTELIVFMGVAWLAIVWPFPATAAVVDWSLPPHSLEALGAGMVVTVLYWVFVLYPAVMFLEEGVGDA